MVICVQSYTSTLNRNSLCTYVQPSLLSRQHAPIKPTITSLEKHQHNIPPPLSRARSSDHQEDAQTPSLPPAIIRREQLASAASPQLTRSTSSAAFSLPPSAPPAVQAPPPAVPQPPSTGRRAEGNKLVGQRKGR